MKANPGSDSWQTGAVSDDCFRRLTTSYWSTTIKQSRAGAYSVSYYQEGSGFRFNNINIPQYANITSATLNVTCSQERNSQPKTKIRAEKTGNATTFTNSTDFDNRPRTTAYVDWNISTTWYLNTTYTSPDFTDVTQEVVDQAEWSSGNSIVIFWDDFDDLSSHIGYHERRVWNYDPTVSSSYYPKLIITWEEPSSFVTLNSPVSTVDTSITTDFNFTPQFYEPIQNASLYTNETGTWSLRQSNTSTVIANQSNVIPHALPIAAEGAILWNVGVWNSTHQIFAESNATFTWWRAPRWRNVNSNVTSIPENGTVLFYGEEYDERGLDFMWTATNETGAWKNYTAPPSSWEEIHKNDTDIWEYAAPQVSVCKLHLSNGTERIVIAFQNKTTHIGQGCCTLRYSDDYGESWHDGLQITFMKQGPNGMWNRDNETIILFTGKTAPVTQYVKHVNVSDWTYTNVTTGNTSRRLYSSYINYSETRIYGGYFHYSETPSLCKVYFGYYNWTSQTFHEECIIAQYDDRSGAKPSETQMYQLANGTWVAITRFDGGSPYRNLEWYTVTWNGSSATHKGSLDWADYYGGLGCGSILNYEDKHGYILTYSDTDHDYDFLTNVVEFNATHPETKISEWIEPSPEGDEGGNGALTRGKDQDGYFTLYVGADESDTTNIFFCWLRTNDGISTSYKYPVDLQDVQSEWTWSNVTWQNTSITGPKKICWKRFLNDTDGNINSTGIFSFWIGAYSLNLRVNDWDLTDAISGAIVYKDSDSQTSNGQGWANWTAVYGTVDIKVKYYGFWVNGTFQVTVDEDKTIDVKCKLYDVTVTVKPNNGVGILSGANVTAFNNTGTSEGKIKSGITVDNTGEVTLTNLPNATLRFIAYAKSDYSVTIANTTKTISSDDQGETVTATQNYATAQMPWELIILPLGTVIVNLFKKKEDGGETLGI